jgi:hypothetical protein
LCRNRSVNLQSSSYIVDSFPRTDHQKNAMQVMPNER